MAAVKQYAGRNRRLLDAWIQWRAGRIADPVARLKYLRRATNQQPGRHKSRRSLKIALIAGLVCLGLLPFPHTRVPARQTNSPAEFRMPAMPGADGPVPEVWLVDRKPDYEIYSNGLRIETGMEVAHRRRQYTYVIRSTGQMRTDGIRPTGIVYHTTESHIAGFEADNNERLQRVGKWLLSYVRKHASYHFVIDRFGRAHRIVAEEDAADHAGQSLWADEERVYMGLNHSFLGIALESETISGDQAPEAVTDAQWHTAHVLTQMLRSRYEISASNCVTHAQVSINPHNHRIGNHTDWAANFAYARVGLPDNYALPVPAMVLFGFGYGPEFVEATGSRLWRGLATGEEFVRQQASAAGMPVPDYRKRLLALYKRTSARLGDSAGDRNDR